MSQFNEIVLVVVIESIAASVFAALRCRCVYENILLFESNQSDFCFWRLSLRRRCAHNVDTRFGNLTFQMMTIQMSFFLMYTTFESVNLLIYFYLLHT